MSTKIIVLIIRWQRRVRSVTYCKLQPLETSLKAFKCWNVIATPKYAEQKYDKTRIYSFHKRQEKINKNPGNRTPNIKLLYTGHIYTNWHFSGATQKKKHPVNHWYYFSVSANNLRFFFSVYARTMHPRNDRYTTSFYYCEFSCFMSEFYTAAFKAEAGARDVANWCSNGGFNSWYRI